MVESKAAPLAAWIQPCLQPTSLPITGNTGVWIRPLFLMHSGYCIYLLPFNTLSGPGGASPAEPAPSPLVRMDRTESGTVGVGGCLSREGPGGCAPCLPCCGPCSSHCRAWGDHW